MEAIRIHKVVEKDGEITMTGLPFKKGQRVEMILMPEVASTPQRPKLTTRQLRRSVLIGLWKDRTDIQDSALYARQLRERAQRRE
jgi:hypothetical protein